MRQIDDETSTTESDAGFYFNGSASRPSILVDCKRYENYLTDFDLPEDLKEELMQSVWQIMFDFASRGFEIHPLQQVEQTCARKSDKFPEAQEVPGSRRPGIDKCAGTGSACDMIGIDAE